MRKSLNKFGGMVFIFLILSLVFLIPFNAKETYSATTIKTNEQVGSDCNVFPPINVKDSFVLSAATLCIPGLLEKANDYRQIKCQEVVCEYNAVLNGISPRFCNKQSAYRTCKYFVGEFYAFPMLSDKIREMIAGILANPAGTLYAVSIGYIRKTPCGTCDSTIVGAKQILLAVNDIAGGIQTFIDMFENGFFPDFNDEDYCGEIENIKSELEKVVAGDMEDDEEFY